MAEFEDPCAEKLIFSDKTSPCTIDCALKHIKYEVQDALCQLTNPNNLTYVQIKETKKMGKLILSLFLCRKCETIFCTLGLYFST